MRSFAISCALAICLSGNIRAEVTRPLQESPSVMPQLFYSNEGDKYYATQNDDGIILTSKYPKAWFHGEPSMDHNAHEKQAVIFLGRSCDAIHNEYGSGNWSWWNDNFNVTFANHSINFANQELFDHGKFVACEDHD